MRDGCWGKMAGKILANARAHGSASAQVPRASTSRYRADERGIVVDADTAAPEACQPTINRHQTTRRLNNTGVIIIARDNGIRDHEPITVRSDREKFEFPRNRTPSLVDPLRYLESHDAINSNLSVN